MATACSGIKHTFIPSFITALVTWQCLTSSLVTSVVNSSAHSGSCHSGVAVLQSILPPIPLIECICFPAKQTSKEGTGELPSARRHLNTHILNRVTLVAAMSYNRMSWRFQLCALPSSPVLHRVMHWDLNSEIHASNRIRSLLFTSGYY